MPRACCVVGSKTGRPISRQIASLRRISSWICSFAMCSFLPVSKLTELMTQWEWMCSRSTWVQTNTSQPAKYSASRRAASWACRGSTAAPFGKLCTMW